MDMQDKEFDELFRSKLDNFEITPTAGVWEGISDALEPRKRKTSLAFIMSIAASIIVIMAVGVLFIPQKVKVNGGNSGRHLVAVAVAVAAKPVGDSRHGSEPVLVKSGAQTKAPITVNSIAQLHHIKTNRHNTVKDHGPMVEEPQPVKSADDEPQLAVVAPKHDVITDAVVPGKETPIAIPLPIAASQDFIAKPTIAATQLPAAEKPGIAAPVKKRHGIRTLGDLINVVVAKVDKRKDKFIEFTNSDDDDESNITGVNLGVIKVKK